MPRGRFSGVICAALLAATGLAAGGIAPAIGVAPGDARAADACTPEQEPNDAPEQAQTLDGAICVTGTLPDGDQDIFLWSLDAEATAGRWTFALDGVPGTVTGLQLLPITSDPGVTPVEVGPAVVKLNAATDATVTVSERDLIVPAGRYVLGISRSGTADGSVPPSIDYRIAITHGQPLPAAGDREPNDDVSHATPERGSFSLSGDLAGSYDDYAWTLSADDAHRTWTIELDGAIGADATIDLLKTDRTDIIGHTVGTDGRVVVPDLQLPAGRYVLSVGPGSDGPQPYVLTVTSSDAPVGDVEPNDTPDTALVLDPAHRVARGRLTPYEDRDDYQLVVDDTLASSLMDIRLVWSNTNLRRDLCIADASGEQLQCADGNTGDTLANLLLPPGTYTVQVGGDDDPSDRYLLRVDVTTAPATDFETEPNDLPSLASAWDASIVMHGRSSPSDLDYFRVTTSGTAQLWELDMAGHDPGAQWLKADGSDLADADVLPDESGAVLTDMYLVPGDHWFRVTADGDYSLTLKALGPPDPNGEREPNNDPVDAEPLAIGRTVRGRLPEPGDRDVYRFSLEAAEHVAIHVTPPADGSMTFRLDDTDTTVAESDAVNGPGQALNPDLTLPAGDYELTLEPGAVSQGTYSVTVVREDPFPPAPALAASVTLDAPASTVAAYWSAGQRVTAQLGIRNTGSAPETLSLDAITSHYAWSAAPGSSQVTVAPGATVQVPVVIQAPADAWGNVPVRTTVRATDATGHAADAWLEVTPTPSGPVTDPDQVWPIPDALLGGLDVALTGLGAVPVPQYDPNLEAQLYDGLTPAGGGFEATLTPGQPVTLTVQLAGDDFVPVAGIILDPQAASGSVSEVPKDFTFLTSVDGVTYAPALTGILSPLPVEQSFVLASPVMAHFARLEIDSVYDDTSEYVALGEFKVVATPGTVVSDGGLDVADPAIGGHAAWMDPQSSDPAFSDDMLTANGDYQSLSISPGARPQWVVGFEDDRTAEVTRLEWTDPPNSERNSRFHSVQVSVSADGPLGPWTDLGTWQLRRSADGSVQPFTFDRPTWVRFIRFTGDIVKNVYSREEPDQIRVIERPTDDEYRSIVAEWGATNPNAIQEALEPPDLAIAPTGPDGNDTEATATPLQPSTPVDEIVHAGEDVDWYSIRVPDGQNTLAFDVGGKPFVGVSLQLFDSGGGQIPLQYTPGATGSATYTATVTPGETYAVEVIQPPFSAVFTFDTSGSMGPYLDFVQEALSAFAGDVVPGRENVTIIPFEEQPLIQGWSDDPYVLQNAVEGESAAGGSSSSETSLINASEALASQEGAKAILVVTDAETSSFDQMAQLWRDLGTIRPVIFAVHVAGSTTPATDQHYMQDWAVSTDGFYQYAQTHAEIDRAFDRMATWLGRPAGYTLSVGISEVKPPPPSNKPGSLSVLGPGNGNPSQVPTAANGAIELILDTSGSMLDQFQGKRRIDVAQAELTNLVRHQLPAGIPVALRLFGNTPSSCDTRLVVPLSPLDPDTVARQINAIRILSSVNTPIAGALEEIGSDLAGVDGPRIVVLVTDGEENCGGKPADAVKALAKEGFDVHVNIIGLAIDSKSLKKQMAAWAKIGHGSFYNASDTGTLATSIAQAVGAPFEVSDANGTVVASGTVNGTPLSLKPGTYTVTVQTDPPITFDHVVVIAGKAVQLSVPSSGAPSSP